MYYVIFGTDKPDHLKIREAQRPAHRDYLRDNPHPVKVHLGGPTLDPAGERMNGTMLVVEAESEAAVRAFLADDPYSRAGIFATLEVRPWAWGLGKPERAD